MLRLNLFGGVDLAAPDGRSLNGDVGGSKPLALLVYLVLEAAHRPVRRDRIIGVLWPEFEQKKARQSLSNALYELRTVIGDVVSSRGQEEIGVDCTRITCDCFEFEELVRNGRLEQAAALYRGDVAADLYVKDAPDFEDWLSRQQQSWRDRFAAVLRKLFDVSVQASELGKAAEWTDKLFDVAPEQDGTVRTLLPLLVERGQHAAAIRLYERYERVLHEKFGIAPPAELTALMADLPRGERVHTARAPSALYVGEPALRPRRSRLLATAAVASLAIAGITIFLAFDLLPSKATGSAYGTATPKVAVMPFAYGAAAQRSASVLSEALQWRLLNVGFEVLNAGTQDTAVVRKLVAAHANAGTMFVVGGDVETQPDRSLLAHVWLKHAASGKRVWDARFTQSAADAHLIVTQLSDAVTTQIRQAAGNAIELASGSEDVSAASWKDVYRARERMEAAFDMRRQGAAAGSATELQDADVALLQVTEREPDWALPWVLRARLAEDRAFNALIAGGPAQGARELDRAISMLDSVAMRLKSEDIHEMRGLLQYRRYQWGVDDVATANRLLSRAEADLRKAAAPGRDPSGSYAALSGVMFAQGKYAEAFVYAQRAYDSNVFLRNNDEVLTRLFTSALHARDDAAAEYWCQELQKTQPGKWPAVLCRVHLAGFAPHVVDVKMLEREIDGVLAAPPIREMMLPRLKAAYAITLAQLGQADSARATLAAVAGSRDPEVMLFRAFALAALKDAPQAHAALRDYLAESRGTRSMALHMRWLAQESQTHMPLIR